MMRSTSLFRLIASEILQHLAEILTPANSTILNKGDKPVVSKSKTPPLQEKFLEFFLQFLGKLLTRSALTLIGQTLN